MNQYYDEFETLSLETTIKDEKDGYYAFENTVFYGEKGGMLSDTGTINGLPVIDLKWDGDVLYHKVDGILENPIIMQVDKENRYINTTVQSVLHLLDGYYATLNLYLPSVGVNPDNQWYEVNTKEITDEDLQKAEDFVNEVIRNEIKCEISYIKGSDYPDPAYQKFNELRIVKFGDINTQPCGTLHVSHTGQLESFVILDHEKTSKGTKVYFTCNHVTNQKLKEEYTLVKEAAKVAGVKKEELCDKVEELAKNVKQLKKELADTKKELIAYKAKELVDREDTIIVYETKDANDVRAIAQALMNQVNKNKLIVAEIDGMSNFAIISPTNEARMILDHLKASVEVTGGGSPKIVTAKANITLEQLQTIVSEML